MSAMFTRKRLGLDLEYLDSRPSLSFDLSHLKLINLGFLVYKIRIIMPALAIS